MGGEPEIQAALFPPYELLLEADPDREKVEAYLKDSDCFIATVRNSVAGVVVVLSNILPLHDLQSGATLERDEIPLPAWSWFARRRVARRRS